MNQRVMCGVQPDCPFGVSTDDPHAGQELGEHRVQCRGMAYVHKMAFSVPLDLPIGQTSPALLPDRHPVSPPWEPGER